MKFISILTTALFLFAATATFAAENPTTSNQEIESKAKDGGYVLVVNGRSLSIASTLGGGGDDGDTRNGSVRQNRMAITIKDDSGVVKQEISETSLSLDLSDLPAGTYTVIIEGSNGKQVNTIKLN